MKPAAPHFQRIDTLRGIAIALVFLYHFFLAVEQRNGNLALAATPPDFLRPVIHLYAMGVLGVPLFFVISGFCIQSSFLSWRAKSAGKPLRAYWPHFFQRRFYRIFPPYLLALLAFYFIKTPDWSSAGELKELGAHILLINTLVPDLFYNLNPSFWSICVEWQLYLLFPLYLFLTLRLGAWWSLAIAAAATVCFQGWLLPLKFPEYIINLPFRWWFDWAIGAYLAIAYKRGDRVFPKHWLVPVLLGGATYASFVFSHSADLQRVVAPFFFAALVESCLWSKRPVNRAEQVIGHLGQCSYTFYLWHQPVTFLLVGLLADLFAQTGPFTIWFGLSAIVLSALWAASWAGYLAVEKPSIALGERLMKRGRTTLPAATGDTAVPPATLTNPAQPAA